MSERVQRAAGEHVRMSENARTVKKDEKFPGRDLWISQMKRGKHGGSGVVNGLHFTYWWWAA